MSRIAVVLAVLSLAWSSPLLAEGLELESEPEWKTFLEAFERYRAFQPTGGWMGMSEADGREFERLGSDVETSVEGLSALVRPGLLDEAGVRLIARAWPMRFGGQVMAPQTQEQQKQLDASFDAISLHDLTWSIEDLESHVAQGRYVPWLDRHLFVDLRRALAEVEGVAPADLVYWVDAPGWAELVRTRERTREALYEGVWRQRARGVHHGEWLREEIAGHVRRLGDDAYEVRESAARALAEQRDAAIPSLLAALDHGDPEIRRRAREILERSLPEPPR